jgi:hypothetical protein
VHTSHGCMSRRDEIVLLLQCSTKLQRMRSIFHGLAMEWTSGTRVSVGGWVCYLTSLSNATIIASVINE